MLHPLRSPSTHLAAVAAEIRFGLAAAQTRTQPTRAAFRIHSQSGLLHFLFEQLDICLSFKCAGIEDVKLAFDEIKLFYHAIELSAVEVPPIFDRSHLSEQIRFKAGEMAVKSI